MKVKKYVRFGIEKNKSFLDGESHKLIAYASTFGNEDRDGDIIGENAFDESIVKINNETIPLLDSHQNKSSAVLGTVVSAMKDHKGLLIEAELADTEDVEIIRKKMMQGHIRKLSVGFWVEDAHFETRNGIDIFIIDKAELMEVSVVPIPANPLADILSVKQIKNDGEETIVTKDELKKEFGEVSSVAEEQQQDEQTEVVDQEPVEQVSENSEQNNEEKQEENSSTEENLGDTEEVENNLEVVEAQESAPEQAQDDEKQNIEQNEKEQEDQPKEPEENSDEESKIEEFLLDLEEEALELLRLRLRDLGE